MHNQTTKTKLRKNLNVSRLEEKHCLL